MQRMTVEEIQQESLAILKHIHSFCQEHGLRYQLAWGTLLGAVRHKGFIPWDDDADIVMPRPDYDRLIAEYADTSKYRLYAPEKRNCVLTYARLCEMQLTYFKAKNPWTRESPGIGVDIMPLDGVSDNLSVFQADTERLCRMREKTYEIRIASHFYPECWRLDFLGKTLLRNLKNLVHLLIRAFIAPWSWLRLRMFLPKMIKLMKRYGYEDAKYCGWAASAAGAHAKWIPKEWVENSVLLDFCDTKFWGPCAYDQWLKNSYGDYMKLPPGAERGGHICSQVMFWRNNQGQGISI